MAKKKVRLTALDGLADGAWITVADVASVLAIGYSKAYELVSRGEIPFLRAGRSIRVQVADFRKWIDAHRLPRDGRARTPK